MDHFDDPPRRFPKSPTYAHVNGLTTPAVKRVARNGKPKPSKAARDRWSQYNTMSDRAMRRLTISQQAVFNQLFRHARNGIAKVSQSAIADATNQSERQVRRAIKALVGIGALRLIERGNSFRLCSTYEVVPDPDNWGHTVRGTTDK